VSHEVVVMKKCTKCGCSKPLSEFHNCASKKSGKFAACKACRNAHNKAKASETGHDVLYARRKQKVGAEAISQQSRSYYLRNKDRIKAKAKEWGEKNPERKKENRKRHYDENRSQYIQYASDWAAENPEKRRRIRSAHVNRIRATRPSEFVARNAARKMVARVMANTGKAKRGKTYDALGYTKQDFVSHIESQFQLGMGWHNHGSWEIDHIIPISELVKNGVTEVSKINALSNLRPIWAQENRAKHAHFELVSPKAAFITKARS